MNFTQLFKSDFLRNTVTLVTGTSAGQIISIGSAPILARIYPPADYGVLAVFMSVSSLLAMLATMEYKIAIILPKEEDKANSLLYICLINTLIFTFLTAILMWVAGGPVARFLEVPEAARWFWLAPVAVFFTGIMQTFTFWTNRHQRYGRISFSRLVSRIFVVATSISLGYYFQGPMGLIIGYLVGLFVEVLTLGAYSLLKDRHLLTPLSRELILEMINTYKMFPIYTLPAQFINRFSNQLPVYVLSKFFGAGVVGLFNMSNRLLGLPVSMVGSAVGEVFKQRASKEYAEKGNCKAFFVKTLKNLFKLSLIPFLVLIFFAPHIFQFALGEQWREAGVFAQLLGIMFLFKFLVSPLANMYYIAGKQVEDFILQIWMLISTILMFWIGKQVFDSTRMMLLLFSLNYTLIYIIYLFRSYQFSKGQLPESPVKQGSTIGIQT